MKKHPLLLLAGLLIPAAVVALFLAGAFFRHAPPAASGVSAPAQETSLSDHPAAPTRTYPWKTNILATIFWIGEEPNTASAWDEDWREKNGGADSPDARIGYGPANHVDRVNPFYVALPFNDLAYRDKAQKWLPKGWARPPKDGKPVSACQDRWVEIKNAQGTVCYAQWEDVGPVRYDHAEYVFGDARPGPGATAGINVSPAVAQYLQFGDKANVTSWCFVDARDVPPGIWLKYEEEAIIYSAMQELKNSGAGSDAKNAATENSRIIRIHSSHPSERSKL